MEKRDRLRRWEAALLAGVAAAALWGVRLDAQQAALADKVVRLHVLANSDSGEDQALKLQVRDAVLAYLTPKLAGITDREGAQACLTRELDGIAQAAERAAEGREVTVTLSQEFYPTREYDGFSLPAGNYTSLRVVLGEGEGHNWWCVVYPPLCVSAAEASRAAMETLDDGTAKIITESDGYVYKFKLLELWGMLTEKLR